MKKLLLINAMVLTMVACGGSDDKNETPPASSLAATSSSSSVASSSSTSSAGSSSSIDVASPPAGVDGSSLSSLPGSSSNPSSASSEPSSASSMPSSASSAPSSASSAPSSTSSSAASSASSSTKWNLVWSDDFDGTAIDPAKWGYEQNCWGGGNNEQQCYTNKADNAFVVDGKLNIVVKKEDFTGVDDAQGNGAPTKTLPYTSARLRTKGLDEWTYGRFEIRAKLPSGQGTWPAIWMLPTNSPYGTWASSGEIDIMEAVNLKAPTDEANAGGVPETRIYGTLHYGRNWPDNKNSGEPYKLPNAASPADDFHTYAVEWEEGEIRWYVDGVHYQTQRKAGWYSQYLLNGQLVNAPDGAPFDDKAQYHMLLNVAVGGAWAGNVNAKGIDATVFPQTMQVDYVKVYECSESPSTGKGCATVDASAKLNAGNVRPSLVSYTPTLPTSTFYIDELATGLSLDKYSPDNIISATETAETGRGKILTIDKLDTRGGSMFFNVGPNKANFSDWMASGELVFDVRLNSKDAASKLLVKLDSGWPNVSDIEVTLPAVGVWQEIRIPVATIINHGNTFSPGSKASLASITNAFVMEPSGQMNVSFDNVRLEGGAVSATYAPLSLFDMFKDSLDSSLQIQKYEAGSVMASSQVAEAGRGNIINIVKTGSGGGNMSFNIAAGTKSLAHWSASGNLKFDIRVNSMAAGSKLLVKLDSGWPNVSDFTVTLPAVGQWGSISIPVATLINNGNSIAAGKASLAGIVNVFVVEPSAAMDLSFDNVRLDTTP